MIQAYNRRQILRASGHFLLSLLGTAACYGFFYWAILLLDARVDYSISPRVKLQIPAVAVVIVYLSGFVSIWREGGFSDQTPDDLILPASFAKQSGLSENLFGSQLGNFAYGLLTVFQTGPLRFIRACQCLTSLMRYSASLDEELEGMLSRIRAAGGWHDAKHYRSEVRLLRYLVRMDQVDFSPHKGRIKAGTTTGFHPA